MRRFRKIALWVLGIGAVLVVVCWGCLQGLLSSGYARSTAGDEISKIVGLPVEVSELSVGAGSTSAALSVPDAGAERPFLRVGSVTTDITLGGLLTGSVSPSVLTLRDVEVNLRLDESGKILSPMPKPQDTGPSDTPLPVVHLSETTLRIQQAGRPEFAITGVSGDLTRDGDKYAITGSADDPDWGKWQLKGHLDAKFSEGVIELTAERAPLRDPLLRSIPYIPPEVWAHVAASGDTAAKITFTFRPGSDLGYAVELRPHAASLTVPDADVTMTEVNGLVTIVPGRVAVKDGAMKLADGTVGLTGNYDFSKPASVITMAINANGVDVVKLPASWGLPKEIGGKLRGTADLVLDISPDGKVDPQGTGNGEILDAKFAGIPAEVRLRLRGTNGRYRFDTMMPGG